ncbi:type VII secretion target [Mycobacterium sp. PSTR-4-N]|uniref:type VII secretion target n=1 Tax=Mycobacterium sp. PSTR-4-N TaxID=2917745 RepID=UPI001F14C825|nr:hypothetical protein [Mycobacterium sp. PSTR-4-N]MCG7594772.1 hypothetical protein [Mycobacterium sp. PSTR-4-N]
MADRLVVDVEAWQDHASWWDQESEAARERLAVDPATLETAQQAFGKIGSSTVGAAYAATLAARDELGQRMSANAQAVAAHIRLSVQTYVDQERDNQQMLRS